MTQRGAKEQVFYNTTNDESTAMELTKDGGGLRTFRMGATKGIAVKSGGTSNATFNEQDEYETATLSLVADLSEDFAWLRRSIRKTYHWWVYPDGKEAGNRKEYCAFAITSYNPSHPIPGQVGQTVAGSPKSKYVRGTV